MKQDHNTDRDRWHSLSPDGRQQVGHGGRVRGESRHLHNGPHVLPHTSRPADAERAAHKLAGAVVLVARPGLPEPVPVPRVHPNRLRNWAAT